MSSKWSLPFRFYNQNIVCIYLSHACYMFRLSHPPWLRDSSNIWWSVQVITLLIMQSSPASSHFLPPRFKSPQHPVLKHPQSMSFP
jgi:hypothetical protein